MFAQIILRWSAGLGEIGAHKRVWILQVLHATRYRSHSLSAASFKVYLAFRNSLLFVTNHPEYATATSRYQHWNETGAVVKLKGGDVLRKQHADPLGTYEVFNFIHGDAQNDWRMTSKYRESDSRVMLYTVPLAIISYADRLRSTAWGHTLGNTAAYYRALWHTYDIILHKYEILNLTI